MSLIDEREKAFENLYARQETVRFLSESRTVGNLAVWVSSKLGHAAEEMTAYTEALNALFITNGSLEAVSAKIAHDYTEKGLKSLVHEIESRIRKSIAQETEKQHILTH